MCKLISFWHNPKTGDLEISDLTSHENTRSDRDLNKKIWREGHYLPDGTIECRVAPADRETAAECAERVRNQWPTFAKFLVYAIGKIGNTCDSLDLSDLTSLPKGVTFPKQCG